MSGVGGVFLRQQRGVDHLDVLIAFSATFRPFVISSRALSRLFPGDVETISPRKFTGSTRENRMREIKRVGEARTANLAKGHGQSGGCLCENPEVAQRRHLS